jgi:hypothetical protein
MLYQLSYVRARPRVAGSVSDFSEELGRSRQLEVGLPLTQPRVSAIVPLRGVG